MVEEPVRGRRPEYRRVRLAVAVVVAGRRDVGAGSEREREETAVLASEDVPGSGRRPEESRVGVGDSVEVYMVKSNRRSFYEKCFYFVFGIVFIC